MTRIVELREKLAKAIADARAVHEKAVDESRNLSDEEQVRYDAFINEGNTLRDQIQREESLASTEDELNRATEPASTTQDTRSETAQRSDRIQATEEYRTAFEKVLRYGPGALTADDLRAMQVDNAEAGGYLVASEMFVDRLIQAVDDRVFVRGLATKFRLNMAQSMGVPSLDTDPDDFAWTTEIQTTPEDTSLAFGKRSLTPHPLAKMIKVSEDLLRLAPNVDDIVTQRLAYKYGGTQETAFMTGDGAGEPLGVFTASNDGVTTARDVSTGNTTTSMTFDGIIEAKFKLDAQYWPRARWAFHSDAVKQLTKLKDGEGQYIWRESARAGEPATLLGLPVETSAFVPNTFTTGLYVGMLADWSNYWIADALDFQLRRLVELYTATNQVGFKARGSADGMPVLAEAFVRVKLA